MRNSTSGGIIKEKTKNKKRKKEKKERKEMTTNNCAIILPRQAGWPARQKQWHTQRLGTSHCDDRVCHHWPDFFGGAGGGALGVS